MLNAWTLIYIALAYVGLLYGIAWYGDKRRIAKSHRNIQAIIYALSLGVYCTSWTFFGAVGSAAATGWGYLSIYLGPALMMIFGHNLIRRMALISHSQRITSIADFIAHRYGRSHSIAVLVTLAAVIGSVPYIALQMKAITTSIDVITSSSGGLPDNFAFYLALALALFAMFFGTRNLDSSEHHRGLMWAIAFESVVKLIAFAAVGLFVIFGVFNGFGNMVETIQKNNEYQALFSPWHIPQGFTTQLILAMLAIICLPRQFHVAIVEFRNPLDLRLSRWLFPVYLLVFSIFVIPITLAGLHYFSGQTVNPDTYVLSLPLAFDQPALTMLVFLGGFSAATGMVIVATVALAIMVSNDIVMPLLLRSRLLGTSRQRDLSSVLLHVRRLSILTITLLAYAYFRIVDSGVPLASIGLLAFAAASQFAPAIIFGVYWKRASRVGAFSGLIVGILGWLIFLMLPSLPISEDSVFSFFRLVPVLDFNQGAMTTLLLNAVVLVVMSLLVPDQKPTLADNNSTQSRDDLLTVKELEHIVGRFLGVALTRKALATHLGSEELEQDVLASPQTVQFCERLLAGSIGSASARTVLATTLSRKGLGAGAVLDLLTRTSEAVQFNRELLESTLDNLTQGVSVIDDKQRLIGWNKRYVELMNFPDGLVHIGQPILELMKFNANRGRMGEKRPDNQISKRLKQFRNGSQYRYERRWLDDTVLEIHGNPMPGGGYVTTYTDITSFKQIEQQLKEANELLEQRVQQRTAKLHETNLELDAARQVAEVANQSKTRFLAAASHDLLQPMNAARLFVSVLRQKTESNNNEESKLVVRIDRCLTAAEELLSALLDISKLDSGVAKPKKEVISVSDLFEQLRQRLKPLANNKNLEFRVKSANHLIYSDRNMLYRILQNFIANSIRYTETGGILLGCRLRGDHLRLSVWDTGVGVPASEAKSIFQEFHRLDYALRQNEKGLGLGLAICDRISRILDHPIDISSELGQGSCFSVTVPLSTALSVPAKKLKPPTSSQSHIQGLKVLCIDNEQNILDGMNILLDGWGCLVAMASTREQAANSLKTEGMPDIVLVDYHLTDQYNGLQLMEYLNEIAGQKLTAIVITADRSSELENEVEKIGYGILRKPIRPAALRAWLNNTIQFKR
ncbi:MAG: hybrid sensor histidine kinase/response regulator [Xanthomonadales bacterium]|nr:hybrid sensor histidine kinase/response regulator [Xanthomonadales bacterium]